MKDDANGAFAAQGRGLRPTWTGTQVSSRHSGVRPLARDSRTHRGQRTTGDHPSGSTVAHQDVRRVPSILTSTDGLHLQRAAGNHAVGRLLDAGGACVPLQREVDTSSSPSLPKYEEGEVPAWAKEQGIPAWAKEDYLKIDAPQTLICSMTPDGKIGSVYFPDKKDDNNSDNKDDNKKGRIRTTHSGGPKRTKHENVTTVQFNINQPAALKAFEPTWKTLPPQEAKGKLRKCFHKWLSQQLKNVPVANAPPWATLVTSPETAHDVGPQDDGPPKGLKLFEIFKNTDGEVKGWHPSRGAAAKFATDKQTIAVLEAAIKHIDKKDLKDPLQRNKEFYEFVKSRLPKSKIIKLIRTPEQISEEVKRVKKSRKGEK